MKKALLFFLFWIFTVCVFCQVPIFTHYTVGDGLAHSTVYFSMQDSKGFIWFCTESGVNRFDGRRFETFTISDGLADNENFKCYEDSKGRIWFLSYNGKLCYFKNDKFYNQSNDVTLKYKISQGKYLIDMIEDSEGNIWFSTYMSVLKKYDGKHIVNYEFQDLTSDEVCYPLFSYNGEINTFFFKSTNNSKEALNVYRVNLQSKKQKWVGAFRRGDGINNFLISRNSKSNFNFHTESGILNFNNDHLKYLVRNKDYNLKFGSSLFDLNDFWVGSENGLVYFPDFKGLDIVINQNVFLKGTQISYLMKDNENGIWINTLSEGVYYLSPTQSQVKNFAGNFIQSVGHSENLDLWATGNYYGNLTIYNKDKIIDSFSFNSINNKSIKYNNRIKSIKWLSQNKLLLGTDFTPFIYDIEKKKLNPLILDYFNKHYGCGFSDFEEFNNGFWITGRYSIYFWDKESSPIPLHGIAGLNIKSEFINKQLLRLTSISSGLKNYCWYSSIQNLYLFDYINCKSTFIAGEKLFKANIKDLKFLHGYLWVATDGNGIFIFKDRKFVKHFTVQNSALSSNICYKFAYNSGDNLWVATNRGICIFNIKNYKIVLKYSKNDLLPNDEVKDICFYNDSAFVVTSYGTSVLNLNKDIPNSLPPRVIIRNLSALGKVYNLNETPQFYYHKGVVVLSYSAITFNGNKTVQYRYRIKSEDEKWNEINADRIEFFNLNPNKYTIEISARKYNSDWSTPINYSFTVLPLWYQSLWFKIIVVLIIFGIFYLWIYRFRKKEKEKTEQNRRISELKNNVLASQMNPHFVFNTLNSLQSLVLQHKADEASYYISRFSKLMRSIMIYSEVQIITLEKELEFLSLYMELEQLRFEEKFEYVIFIDNTCVPSLIEIPSLIIQPFVENAIKYGLGILNEKGKVEISFKREDNYLIVNIIDNGVGRAVVAQKQSESIKEYESKGINYTRERLYLIAGEKARKEMINISDKYINGKVVGTIVELVIPIINE